MKSATDPQCPSEKSLPSTFPSTSQLERKMNLIESRLPGKNGIIENSFPKTTTRVFEKKRIGKSKKDQAYHHENENNRHKDDNKTTLSSDSAVSTSNPVSSSNQTLLTNHLCHKSRDRGTTKDNNNTTPGSTESNSRTVCTSVVAETPPLSTSPDFYSNPNHQSTSQSAVSNTNHSHNSQGHAKSSATKQLKLGHLRDNNTTPSRSLLGRKGASTSTTGTNNTNSSRKKSANPTKDKKHSVREINTVHLSPSENVSRKRPRVNCPLESQVCHRNVNNENTQSAVVTVEPPSSLSRDRFLSKGGSGSNMSPILQPNQTPNTSSNQGNAIVTGNKVTASHKHKKDRDSISHTKTIFHFFGSPTGKTPINTPSSTSKIPAISLPSSVLDHTANSGTSVKRHANKEDVSSFINNDTTHNAHISNSSSIKGSHSNFVHDTSQIDRLKQEISELRKKCQNQQSEINSIRNNTTIESISLKSKLQRKDQEIKQIQQEVEQIKKSKDKAFNIIEKLILDQNSRDTKDKRQKLASDGARLGRFVYTRAGLHSVENWEYGHAKKAIEKKRLVLKKKKEELEFRHQCIAREHEEKKSKIVKPEYNSQVNENPTNDKLSLFDLEVMEAEEGYRMQLIRINEQNDLLDEEEHALHKERNAHVRELRRAESEDKSRFKTKPKLNNRYILLCLLGKGGFSEVWRAYDLLNLREVAVKIHQLDPRWSESKKENYTKHVSREYEIHRDVRHPRIVSLYDVFEIDNDSFATVLECCKGTDLDTLLKQKKTLPERTARAILLQILSGMQYLSSPSDDGSRQGIIHYDLKPANILFDEFGYAKITDFGLSKIVDATDPADSMELTSQGAGTYWYLPPECFVTHQAVRISNKVDVWSIGVIFYQMIFGRRPFGDGQSQEKVLLNNTMLNAKEVRFPDNIKVSKGCKSFLKSCLTHDQVYRPSIAQLCENPYLVQKDLLPDS